METIYKLYFFMGYGKVVTEVFVVMVTVIYGIIGGSGEVVGVLGG